MERDAIRALANTTGFPKISLYFPTHEKGPGVQQDPIRLKNAVAKAADELRAAGHGRLVEELLAEARSRAEPQEFWLYQGQGLAVFIDQDGTRWEKLPEPVEELVVVADRFHLRPLIRMFGSQTHGYLLAVTRNSATFYDVRRHGIAAVTVPDMPESLLAFRSGGEEEDAPPGADELAAEGRAGQNGPSQYDTYGRDAESAEDIGFGQFLHRIARAVEHHLSRNPAPLTIAAEPRTFGHLRPLFHANGVLEQGLQVNPESQSEQALHAAAWRILAPHVDRGRQDALERLRAQLGSGDWKLGTDVAALAKAAVEGRLEAVFYAPGAHRWGRYDEERHDVAFADAPGAGDEDLIDFIAVRAMQMGGAAYPLRDGEADLAPVAGLMRF